ncbi:MAG: phenylphosphate carboxylase subunit delta [Planctomycetaceae bacterium]|nr:phenylphosphate carboxylase subunit delta [Planctomycetaceae bacterium]
MNLAQRCAQIRLILTDVDGVLTDGGVIMDDHGVHTLRFHIRDGLGAKIWQRSGGKIGFVTGRKTEALARRAADLGVDVVRQGNADKLPLVEEICREFGFTAEQVAFLGDDLIDLKPIQFAGLGVAVADAVAEVRAAADYVTSVPGGRGALRELIELILQNSGRWEDVLARYTA